MDDARKKLLDARERALNAREKAIEEREAEVESILCETEAKVDPIASPGAWFERVDGALAAHEETIKALQTKVASLEKGVTALKKTRSKRAEPQPGAAAKDACAEAPPPEPEPASESDAKVQDIRQKIEESAGQTPTMNGVEEPQSKGDEPQAMTSWGAKDMQQSVMGTLRRRKPSNPLLSG